MYISANLPIMYGAFQKIRDDNYPFSRNFTDYLEGIVTLGEAMGMSITQLIGFIEDSLMGDERLPDIPSPPKGSDAIEFRYSIQNKTIESYYRQQDISNKDINLLIIQMTLRLSVRFGSSLQRLRSQIARIQKEPMEALEPKAVKIPSGIKVTKGKSDPILAPVKRDVSPDQEERQASTNQRLAKLAAKAKEIANQDETSIEGDVVETNANLLDFIDMD